MKKTLLFLAITLLFAGSVFAQLTINANTYRFNAASTAPIGIVPIQLIGSNADQIASAVTDIGFTFWFAGTAYTQFSVDENGLMKLGSSAIIPEPVNSMASTLNLPKIAPYWDDLSTGTTGSVGYFLFGTAPNRILIVSWNVTVPKNLAVAANALFQVQLYEGTSGGQGSIFFGFGAAFPALNAGGYSIGIGVSATDFGSVTVASSAAGTTCAYGTANNNNTIAIVSAVRRHQFSTDNAAPTINLNNPISIPNTPGTGNRTLTTNVADQAGSVVSGIPLPPSLNVPRIYFKKNVAGAWYSTAASLTSGTAASGTWLFTVDHSLLGGVIGGDQVYYYVIAQDNGDYKGSPNIKSSPIGVVATNVNSVTTPPATVPYYTIPISFSGIKTVGTGGDFASLTLVGGLFDNMNSGELTGNLTVNIISDLTAETGLKGLNAWANGTGGPFTVTINPVGNRIVSGVTINGGNGSVINLIGTTGVTIDGLNDGTNSLTFVQTGRFYVGSVIDLKGASNNTITRTTINGYGAGNYAITITNSTTASSNNTISYCTLANPVITPEIAGNGIGLLDGFPATLVCNQNIIDHNTISNIIYTGIEILGKYSNTVISNNEIYNTVGLAQANSFKAINISFSISGTTNIFNNKIHDLKPSGTFAGSNVTAIHSNGPTGTTTNIYNNVIYLDPNSTDLLQTWYGIRTLNPGAVNIYYNSIYIGGTNVTAGSSYGLSREGSGTTNILNNVVFNARSNSTGTGNHYGIYTTSTTTLLSNYNDIYVNGTGGCFGFSNSLNRVTLLNWQVATGKDANSISVDPQFTSVTNLIPLNTALIAGTPIAGYTTDFVGTLRGTPPTMGAYEMVLPPKVLNLKVFLQALILGRPNSPSPATMFESMDEIGAHFGTGIADQITVELHNAASYTVIAYTAINLNLSTVGDVNLTVPVTYNGSYYITIKHRNSIVTTSANPVSFAGSIINYDFSTSAEQAYGNNQQLMNGVYSIFCADIDQDGSIGIIDMGGVENASINFISGYVPEDIDGDGSVGIVDMGSVENNGINFVGAILPPSKKKR